MSPFSSNSQAQIILTRKEMAPILLQAPDYSTLTSAAAPRIPLSEYMNSAFDFNFVLYTRLTTAFHSLGQNTENFRSRIDSWGPRFYIFICQILWMMFSGIWHFLSSCFSLFWGFGLGVLIVLALVRIMRWASNCEREEVEDEKGCEYLGLSKPVVSRGL